MSYNTFTSQQIRALADALGHTDEGLTGSQITELLAAARIEDPAPAMTKRHRLYAAFANDQNSRRSRNHILGFITYALNPARFTNSADGFEPLRARVNQALAFAGLGVRADGSLHEVDQASTLSEAKRRADALRADLLAREVHADVLRFCREELLAENYFHAVFEAVKSVADKLRKRTGSDDDGAALATRAFGGSAPALAINDLRTSSERSEQAGFTNMLVGVFGMFRNPAAHEARIHWVVSRMDAADLLSMVSLIHRRIDAARALSRADEP